MTTTREEFEAWMTSETNVREDAVWHEDKQRYTLLSRKQADWVLWQAAHLAGQRAMRDQAETACRTVKVHVDGYHQYTAHKVRGECSLAVQRLMEVKPS